MTLNKTRVLWGAPRSKDGNRPPLWVPNIEWPIEFCGFKRWWLSSPCNLPLLIFSDSESSLKVEAGHILDSGFPNHPHKQRRWPKGSWLHRTSKRRGGDERTPTEDERSMVALWGHFAHKAVSAICSVVCSVQLEGAVIRASFCCGLKRNDVEKKSKSGSRPLVTSRSAAN